MEPSGDRPERGLAREDVEEIKEEIRSEEAGSSRTGESPSRTERAQQATPQGRERGDQPEGEREEDRGLVDRTKDAVMGSEEESRRREDNERSDRR
jgi:hypothetical protein